MLITAKGGDTMSDLRYGGCCGIGGDVATDKLADSLYSLKTKRPDGALILTADGCDEIWKRVDPGRRPNCQYRIKVGRSYYHYICDSIE